MECFKQWINILLVVGIYLVSPWYVSSWLTGCKILSIVSMYLTTTVTYKCPNWDGYPIFPIPSFPWVLAVRPAGLKLALLAWLIQHLSRFQCSWWLTERYKSIIPVGYQSIYLSSVMLNREQSWSRPQPRTAWTFLPNNDKLVLVCRNVNWLID